MYQFLLENLGPVQTPLHSCAEPNWWIKVIRQSYFVGLPSYFEALWYPHLYFDRKSNI